MAIIVYLVWWIKFHRILVPDFILTSIRVTWSLWIYWNIGPISLQKYASIFSLVATIVLKHTKWVDYWFQGNNTEVIHITDTDLKLLQTVFLKIFHCQGWWRYHDGNVTFVGICREPRRLHFNKTKNLTGIRLIFSFSFCTMVKKTPIKPLS